MSDSTGIIFNNEMNDFSIPVASGGLLPAPANFIAPRKSPISSMSPVIVLNEDKDVTLVLGGSGGILIMTSIVQFIIYTLYLNQTLAAAMNMNRIHHQLQPMRIQYEADLDPEIINFLAAKGHTMYRSPTLISGFAALVAISNRNGDVQGAVDPRRGGKITVF